MKVARTIALVVSCASILPCFITTARADEPKLPAMTLALDGGVVRRTTLWRDDLFGTLRDYAIGGAPSVGIEATFFPGAFFTEGRLAWIGITGRVEAILGIDSKRTAHDASLPTRAGAFSFALRGRLPLRHAALSLEAGIASRTFIIQAEGATLPDFPSVRYVGPRLGFNAEITLPQGFSITPRGALARWISTGDLASAAWFPHARSWGADLGLRVAWSAPIGVGPYLDLGWSRDVTALRPQPGEARVAGGLADDRVSARAGIAVSFPSRGH